MLIDFLSSAFTNLLLSTNAKRGESVESRHKWGWGEAEEDQAEVENGLGVGGTQNNVSHGLDVHCLFNKGKIEVRCKRLIVITLIYRYNLTQQAAIASRPPLNRFTKTP